MAVWFINRLADGRNGGVARTGRKSCHQLHMQELSFGTEYSVGAGSAEASHQNSRVWRRQPRMKMVVMGWGKGSADARRAATKVVESGEED